MSATIIKSAQPAKEKVEKLLEEVRKMDLTQFDQKLSREEIYQQYEARKRMIEEKIMRLELHIGMLEIANAEWRQYIQQISTPVKRKEEEDKYAQMVDEKTGVLNLISEGKETIIILKIHKNEIELVLQRLEKDDRKEEVTQQRMLTQTANHLTVNLPQLPLPTFSGNPNQWRGFWSSFEAAIHLQNIRNIQKLNYLIACLKGDALQAVRGYDIIPENYDVIKKVLTEKFGQSHTIKRSLYNELHWIKKNDREWRVTVEAIERILRQLEAMGENLEQSSIEIMIESRLPAWILDKVYQQKEQEPWSVKKLRCFLEKLVLRNEEVMRIQSSHMKEQKPFTSKPKSYLQHSPNETSALVTNVPKKSEEDGKPKGTKIRRPCAFCNKDHWDNECHIYSTLKQRIERLKKLNACHNCIESGHTANDCKKRKRTCFFCKGDRNTALCQSKYKDHEQYVGLDKERNNSVNVITPDENTRYGEQKKDEVLLLCKEIKVVNPTMHNIQEDAIVLFDIGSESSFISRKLAQRLNLEEGEHSMIKISTFSNKQSTSYPSYTTVIGIKTTDSRIIPLKVNVLEYLTNPLPVVSVDQHEVSTILNQIRLDGELKRKKRPDILIGADYFSEFIQFKKSRKAKSGFSLMKTKVGPILTGKGYIKEPCNVNEIITHPEFDITQNVTSPNISVMPTTVLFNKTKPDIDQFWKLEVIGIQEKPDSNEDEGVLERFKETITKTNGRYQVTWPWKETNFKLNDNFKLCFGRLKSLVKRLQNDERLRLMYDETIKNQLQSSIIEEVDDKLKQAGIIHYLPHHEVITPNKSTTKLRIVYDASAHLKGSKSLSDVLYRGPTTLPDLAGILLRSRAMDNIIIADIEKAFYN